MQRQYKHGYGFLSYFQEAASEEGEEINDGLKIMKNHIDFSLANPKLQFLWPRRKSWTESFGNPIRAIKIKLLDRGGEKSAPPRLLFNFYINFCYFPGQESKQALISELVPFPISLQEKLWENDSPFHYISQSNRSIFFYLVLLGCAA